MLIHYPLHPRAGERVVVVRRLQHAGSGHFVIEQPDGTRASLPARVVAGGDVFLMNRHSGDSLDGRYFGPLPITTVVGRADPLWTDEEH